MTWDACRIGEARWTLSPNFPAWVAIARTEIQIAYTYRLNMPTAIFLTGLQIYLLTLVWKAAYGDQTEVAGISVDADAGLPHPRPTCNCASCARKWTSKSRSGSGRARSGSTSAARSGIPASCWRAAVGDMLGRCRCWWWRSRSRYRGRTAGPGIAEAGIGYVLALILAWIVAAQLNLVIGLVSFWTLEMNGFRMVYTLVGNFATGALVPLWFMPDLMRAFVQLLPFQAIAFVPVSIYVGEPATGAVWSALLLQLSGRGCWCWRSAGSGAGRFATP